MVEVNAVSLWELVQFLRETLIYSEFPRYRYVPPFSMIVNHRKWSQTKITLFVWRAL